MHACVLHAARDLRCEAIEPQSFGPGDVRIAVKAGGFCGSDLHYYFSGGVGDFRVKEPLILGHEIAGEVIEVGEEVAGDLRRGPRRGQPGLALHPLPLLPGRSPQSLRRHASSAARRGARTSRAACASRWSRPPAK